MSSSDSQLTNSPKTIRTNGQKTSVIAYRYLLLYQEFKRDRNFALQLRAGSHIRDRHLQDLAANLALLRYYGYILKDRKQSCFTIPDRYLHIPDQEFFIPEYD